MLTRKNVPSNPESEWPISAASCARVRLERMASSSLASGRAPSASSRGSFMNEL